MSDVQCPTKCPHAQEAMECTVLNVPRCMCNSRSHKIYWGGGGGLGTSVTWSLGCGQPRTIVQLLHTSHFVQSTSLPILGGNI